MTSSFSKTKNLEPNMVPATILSDVIGNLDKSLNAKSIAVLQGNFDSPSMHRASKNFLQSGSGKSSVFRLDMAPFQSVVEYEPLDQVITVETGITVSRLNEILAPQNQFFPCQSGAHWTVLDAINVGDGGFLEHSTGGIRSLILGLEIILTSGEQIKTGGKVVKNVSGYDLTKLFVGSRGTLGLPYRAHLRLSARPQKSVTMIFGHSDVSVLLELVQRLLKTGLPFAGFELIQNNQSQFGFCKISESCLEGRLSSQSAILALNLMEHETVISELVPQIEFQIKDQSIIYGTDDELFFNSLEEVIASSEWTLETSVTQSLFAELQSQLKSIGVDSHFRPGNGRLRVLCKNTSQMQNVANALKERASIVKPLIVATSTGEFEYFTEQLPSANSSLTRIREQLKQKFDPQGCLNPFARL